MYKDILQHIEGIEYFPIVGLILFVIIFGLVTYWALRLDKQTIREMEKLPFDKNDIIDGDK